MKKSRLILKVLQILILTTGLYFNYGVNSNLILATENKNNSNEEKLKLNLNAKEYVPRDRRTGKYNSNRYGNGNVNLNRYGNGNVNLNRYGNGNVNSNRRGNGNSNKKTKLNNIITNKTESNNAITNKTESNNAITNKTESNNAITNKADLYYDNDYNFNNAYIKGKYALDYGKEILDTNINAHLNTSISDQDIKNIESILNSFLNTPMDKSINQSNKNFSETINGKLSTIMKQSDRIVSENFKCLKTFLKYYIQLISENNGNITEDIFMKVKKNIKNLKEYKSTSDFEDICEKFLKDLSNRYDKFSKKYKFSSKKTNLEETTYMTLSDCAPTELVKIKTFKELTYLKSRLEEQVKLYRSYARLANICMVALNNFWHYYTMSFTRYSNIIKLNINEILKFCELFEQNWENSKKFKDVLSDFKKYGYENNDAQFMSTYSSYIPILNKTKKDTQNLKNQFINFFNVHKISDDSYIKNIDIGNLSVEDFENFMKNLKINNTKKGLKDDDIKNNTTLALKNISTLINCLIYAQIQLECDITYDSDKITKYFNSNENNIKQDVENYVNKLNSFNSELNKIKNQIIQLNENKDENFNSSLEKVFGWHNSLDNINKELKLPNINTDFNIDYENKNVFKGNLLLREFNRLEHLQQVQKFVNYLDIVNEEVGVTNVDNNVIIENDMDNKFIAPLRELVGDSIEKPDKIIKLEENLYNLVEKNIATVRNLPLGDLIKDIKQRLKESFVNNVKNKFDQELDQTIKAVNEIISNSNNNNNINNLNYENLNKLKNKCSELKKIFTHNMFKNSEYINSEQKSDYNKKFKTLEKKFSNIFLNVDNVKNKFDQELDQTIKDVNGIISNNNINNLNYENLNKLKNKYSELKEIFNYDMFKNSKYINRDQKSDYNKKFQILEENFPNIDKLIEEMVTNEKLNIHQDLYSNLNNLINDIKNINKNLNSCIKNNLQNDKNYEENLLLLNFNDDKAMPDYSNILDVKKLDDLLKLCMTSNENIKSLNLEYDKLVATIDKNKLINEQKIEKDSLANQVQSFNSNLNYVKQNLNYVKQIVSNRLITLVQNLSKKSSNLSNFDFASLSNLNNYLCSLLKLFDSSNNNNNNNLNNFISISDIVVPDELDKNINKSNKTNKAVKTTTSNEINQNNKTVKMVLDEVSNLINAELKQRSKKTLSLNDEINNINAIVKNKNEIYQKLEASYNEFCNNLKNIWDKISVDVIGFRDIDIYFTIELFKNFIENVKEGEKNYNNLNIEYDQKVKDLSKITNISNSNLKLMTSKDVDDSFKKFINSNIKNIKKDFYEKLSNSISKNISYISYRLPKFNNNNRLEPDITVTLLDILKLKSIVLNISNIEENKDFNEKFQQFCSEIDGLIDKNYKNYKNYNNNQNFIKTYLPESTKFTLDVEEFYSVDEWNKAIDNFNNSVKSLNSMQPSKDDLNNFIYKFNKVAFPYMFYIKLQNKENNEKMLTLIDTYYKKLNMFDHELLQEYSTQMNYLVDHIFDVFRERKSDTDKTQKTTSLLSDVKNNTEIEKEIESLKNDGILMFRILNLLDIQKRDRYKNSPFYSNFLLYRDYALTYIFSMFEKEYKIKHNDIIKKCETVDEIRNLNLNMEQMFNFIKQNITNIDNENTYYNLNSLNLYKVNYAERPFDIKTKENDENASEIKLINSYFCFTDILYNKIKLNLCKEIYTIYQKSKTPKTNFLKVFNAYLKPYIDVLTNERKDYITQNLFYDSFLKEHETTIKKYDEFNNIDKKINETKNNIDKLLNNCDVYLNTLRTYSKDSSRLETQTGQFISATYKEFDYVTSMEYMVNEIIHLIDLICDLSKNENILQNDLQKTSFLNIMQSINSKKDCLFEQAKQYIDEIDEHQGNYQGLEDKLEKAKANFNSVIEDMNKYMNH